MISGLRTKRKWEKKDRISLLLTVIFTDLQLVVGGLLYFVASPTVRAALGDMKVAMKDTVLRFFAVEHFVMMFLVVVVVHVASVVAKKATDDQKRFKIVSICAAIVFVLILVGVPWPFREALGRGWLPGM